MSLIGQLNNFINEVSRGLILYILWETNEKILTIKHSRKVEGPNTYTSCKDKHAEGKVDRTTQELLYQKKTS